MGSTGTEDRADGRTVRWEAHRAERRRALLDAAIEAIEAQGAQVGVDAIAAHAGVSRTVLYRYFDGRDDLQRSVARRAVELLLVKLIRPLRSGATPRRMIRGVVRAHIRWLDEHPELYRLTGVRSNAGPAGREAFAEGETIFAARLAEVLGRYMSVLGVQDAAMLPLVHGFIGMVESAGDWWSGHRDAPDALSQRRLVETLSDSIWYVIDGQLRARGATLDPDLPMTSFVEET